MLARLRSSLPQTDWTSPIADLAWAAVFALAYGQSPLFTSNQNQYFLHGMAKAGIGQLASDWLANTVDPTPLFSWVVLVTIGRLAAPLFYLEYGLLLALYFLSMRSLLMRAAALRALQVPSWLVSLALVAMHAAPTRIILGRLLGADAGFLLEGGLAGQRLLGSVFQPSSFGVFLILSLALFLAGRRYLAIASAVAAATFHPTYLLSAGVLTLAYLWIQVRMERDVRGALQMGGFALLLVLPSLLTTERIHRPTSPGVWAQAAQLLVEERIPQHALVGEWFGPLSLLTIIWIIAGVWLARGDRLFPVLLAGALAGAVLSVIQWASGSLRLALLFPWRVSAWLAPLGTGLILVEVILPWLIQRADNSRRLALTLGRLTPILALLLSVAGVARTVLLFHARQTDSSADMFNAVRSQLGPGQHYLIPPKLQRFRLETGAPAFVDFKSIPYRDTEVLEWNERLRLVGFFYRDQQEFINCELLPRIAAIDGTTHVILESDQFGLECPGLDPIYQNPDFALYSWNPR
jgi:hypothetical protein